LTEVQRSSPRKFPIFQDAYTFKAKIIGQGRITIPEEARSGLGVHDGDWIAVEVSALSQAEQAKLEEYYKREIETKRNPKQTSGEKE